MIISIASGKGGTGKTTVSANLARYLGSRPGSSTVNLLDCDVEEPNVHLFFEHTNITTTPFHVSKPKLDETSCNGCGTCRYVCAFNAISLMGRHVLFFPELCHACGACVKFCPQNALTNSETHIGDIYDTRLPGANITLSWGTLNVGEILGPALIDAVKEKIRPDAINILDCPPGAACPVVAAMKDTDVTILVTEPTPMGLHDLRIAAELAFLLKIPTGIVINRSDSNDSIIAEFAEETNIPIIGSIPFDRKFAVTYSKGDLLLDHHPELEQNFEEIYSNIEKMTKTREVTAKIPEKTKKKTESGEIVDFQRCGSDSYKEIIVISGKGGTGKTTVSAGFAKLANHAVVFDCDVDAANLSLLLVNEPISETPFSSGQKAIIDPEKCVSCGACEKNCAFEAINSTGEIFEVDPFSCEGCGLCGRLCPADAIMFKPGDTGCWRVSKTDKRLPLVHADLNVGEENSGKLVAQVKMESTKFAKNLGTTHLLGDGPPGAGCPVIASLSGADLALVVTEPTVSGLHDMTRVLKLTKHFNIETKVIINKADINVDMADAIALKAEQNGSKVIAKIPFDSTVQKAANAGKSVVEYPDSVAGNIIRDIWNNL